MNNLCRLIANWLRLRSSCVRIFLLRVVHVFMVSILIVIVCSTVGKSISTAELHNDEISWFFHTAFFERIFITHDMSSSYWYSYESYDHPHFSKYVYGAYLFFRYPSIFKIRAELEKAYGRWKFYFNPDTPYVRETIFAPYLHTMRQINIVFVAGSCFLIGGILYFLSRNIILSYVGVLVFAYNPFFLNVMVRGTSDAHMIFFMLASFFLYCLYGIKKKFVWLITSSVCAGISLSAKLTGILIIYAQLIIEAAWWKMGRQHFKTMTRSIGVIVLITSYVWVVLNPTLYTQPITGTIHYFDFRYVMSKDLQLAFPDVSLDSIFMRMYAVYCTVIESHCAENYFRGTLFPNGLINIFAIAAGIFYFIFNMKDRTREHAIFGFGIYATVVIFVSTMMLFINADRYFIPIQIIVFIVELVGMYYVSVLCHRFLRYISA